MKWLGIGKRVGVVLVSALIGAAVDAGFLDEQVGQVVVRALRTLFAL